MKEITNLRKLRQVGGDAISCPKCGDSLNVVSNGWFHGELFFCSKESKVFSVQLREMKSSKEFIEQSKKEVELDEVRRGVTYKNVFEVKKFLESNKHAH